MALCTPQETDAARRQATVDRLDACRETIAREAPGTISPELVRAYREANRMLGRWFIMEPAARAGLHRQALRLVERMAHERADVAVAS